MIDDQGTCRRMVTRQCPPSGPCSEVCARFESDDPEPWLEGIEKLMTGRNVFENNDPTPDEEDIKAVGSGPHIMLPPLAEGHEYALTDLPSGRKAVVVVDSNQQSCNCGPGENCSYCKWHPGKWDQYGRHQI